MSMTAAERRKFSGWQTVQTAGAYVFAHRVAAVRAVALWVVIAVIAQQLTSQILGWFLRNEISATDIVAVKSEIAMARAVAGWVIGLFFATAYAAIIVAWYRTVLLGERQPVVPLPSLRGLMYVLNVGFMYLVILAPIFVGTITRAVAPQMLGIGQNYADLFILLGEFLALPAFLISMRLVLKLPAIAVDDEAMTLGRSWVETSGIWPGLAWGTLVIYGPVIAAIGMLNLTVTKVPVGIVTAILASAVRYGLAFLTILIYATFLALVYREVVGPIEDVAAAFE